MFLRMCRTMCASPYIPQQSSTYLNHQYLSITYCGNIFIANTCKYISCLVWCGPCNYHLPGWTIPGRRVGIAPSPTVWTRVQSQEFQDNCFSTKICSLLLLYRSGSSWCYFQQKLDSLPIYSAAVRWQAEWSHDHILRRRSKLIRQKRHAWQGTVLFLRFSQVQFSFFMWAWFEVSDCVGCRIM